MEKRRSKMPPPRPLPYDDPRFLRVNRLLPRAKRMADRERIINGPAARRWHKLVDEKIKLLQSFSEASRPAPKPDKNVKQE